MLPLLRVVLSSRTPYTLTPPSGILISEETTVGFATAGITFLENGTWSADGNACSPTSGNWIEPTSAASSRNFYIKYTMGAIAAGGTWNVTNEFTADDTYVLVNGSGDLSLSARDASALEFVGVQDFQVTFSVALDALGAGEVTSASSNTVYIDYTSGI
jgi:hypothetical protein